MIDLTLKFETAFHFSNQSFREMKWYSALVLLSTETNFVFVWDDIDDSWIKLGNNDVYSIMVARYLPLIFARDLTIIKKGSFFFFQI